MILKLKLEIHWKNVLLILTNKTSNIDKYIDELEKMEGRWRDEYNKAHPYVYKSPSYAHEEALAASFDLFSDD